VEYRRAVAAYAVAHALAGEVLPGFGFALGSARVVAVAVETDEHADDVRVRFFGGHKAQVQAKRTLRFGSALSGAVAQWTAAATSGLDPVRDRLVLVTRTASGPMGVLAQALERCKTDEPGAFTAGERNGLARLDGMLSGLSAQQRDLVRRCAVITALDVEEEQSTGAAHARLLLQRVVGGEAAVRAWRDLVRHCGRVGRLRGGFGVEGWVRLLQEEGYQVTGYETPAADAARRAEALDRYRDLLRSRGTAVDLRPLGAETAPIPLLELDASVECVPAGADRRDAEPLPWSLLRRCRVLLTGLPGGGKSTAIAAAAAALVDAAGAPLPLVVSLREVDARDRSRGFADRVLDTAVKDVPAADRPLVREALERGLDSGATALLLDSLDETHERRGAVVSEVGDLCTRVSADVPVLLASRDVAYAQAATLGWDDLRLLEPEKPERTVRAVLTSVAVARHVEDFDTWVERRVEWITAILDHDRAVGETPLVPVLLALLAADRDDRALPVTRGEILHQIVEAAVRRREARRDPGLRFATLNEHDSANATLAAFAVEAGVLGDSGGQATMATVNTAVTLFLTCDWGLPAGAAASTASAIVHFWDEIGIFVIRGADETITPRMELFLDIGDAVHATAQSPDVVEAWVDARIRERRHEPLILAAALSQTAGERLLAAACDSGEHELLIAASAAVRQRAQATDGDRGRLIAALATDAAAPDAQGWTSCLMLLDLAGDHSSAEKLSEVLIHYPTDNQVIAKTALALRRSHDATKEPVLLDALRVHHLPRLPSRQSATPSARPVDSLHGEVVEAAARRLLGRVEEATGLVVGLLDEVGIGLNKRLVAALKDAGLIDAASDVLARQSRAAANTLAWLKDYDEDEESRFLDHLAQHPPAELTVAQASRLTELASLHRTLGLRVIGAWPRRQEHDSWLEFVDVVAVLGGFDPARLAAEASITRRRIAQCDSEAFTALGIASQRRRLNRWEDVDSPAAAALTLAESLFMGKGTARVAAAALSTAPPEIAIPLLEDALPDLQSRRAHQRLAAHALARLKSDEPLTEWATSDNRTLRLVAAERLPHTVDGQLNPLLCQLMHDTDPYVAVAAVHTVADAPATAAVDELKSIATAEREEWTCQHCGSPNPAAADHCVRCHVVPPDPAEIARDILAELTEQT
jgi:ribosomal protein L40E